MKVIRAPSLGRAHELVVRYILQNGRFLRTENGEDTVETDEVCLRVETPFEPLMSSEYSRFKESFLDSYAHNLLFGSNSVFDYDYHARLFGWGCGLSDMRGEIHCDQVRYIVEMLKKSPESRRAVGVTWCPPVDEWMANCPCLQLIQCVIREGRLDMKVVFRSNDMLSAAGANMFALVRLQEFMAKEVGVHVGAYTHISLIPHIYFKRDMADIPPFCQRGIAFTPSEVVCRVCGGCTLSQR
jgi:thymidylate synthase